MENRIYGSIDKIDRQLILWLNQHSNGTLIGNIHSIFDKVINIISPNQDNLFSLAIEEVVQSPQMMKTNDNSCFQKVKNIVKQGTPIFCNGLNEVKIQNVILNYRDAKPWNGKITEDKNHKQINICYLKQINDFIQINGVDSGILSAWNKYFNNGLHEQRTTTIYTTLFFDKLKKIDIAARKHNDTDFLNASYEFIGLGVGLTPSGDDFILACLAVWKYLGLELYDIYVDNGWIDRVKGLTTTVSYFMLKNCIKGYVNDVLLNMLRYNNESIQINSLLKDVLKIGSTSGTDMLIGMLFAYEIALYQK